MNYHCSNNFFLKFSVELYFFITVITKPRLFIIQQHVELKNLILFTKKKKKKESLNFFEDFYFEEGKI